MFENSTVVTAGDGAFAWGALLLVASMRMNGMRHPVVIGAMDWPPEMARRVSALGGVTIRELPPTRQCLTCQKPMLMSCDDVKTDWVCWADADAVFIGDCSEWLVGDSPDEIVVRKYEPVPPDFTPETLRVWKNDVARFQGGAREKSCCDTRMNAAFIVIHRRHFPFLRRWQDQIGKVLPPDVEIIMQKGSDISRPTRASSAVCSASIRKRPKSRTTTRPTAAWTGPVTSPISPTTPSRGRCGTRFR